MFKKTCYDPGGMGEGIMEETDQVDMDATYYRENHS